MNEYLFWLGSNPTLSAVELWTKFKRESFVPHLEVAGLEYMLLGLEKKLPNDFLKSLGGIERIAILLDRQSHLWEAEELVNRLSPTQKKFNLGISTLNIDHNYAKKVGFEVKNLFKKKGVKVKFILSKGRGGQLNSAQVIFNKLTSSSNKELTIVGHESGYFLAETMQIQDIQAYERRDTGRPVRDAWVGMLPPKLAQIMLNLVPQFSGQPPVVLDPFCGVGTILQEGYLMGYEMVGSDVSERMVEASNKNLDALGTSGTEFLPRLSPAPPKGGACRPHLLGKNCPHRRPFRHDVRDPFPEDLAGKVDAVVTEPDLGEPLTSPLPQSELDKRIYQSKKLYLKFFANVRSVLKDNAWIVFALPAFRRRSSEKEEFALFPTSFLDEVQKFGYRFNQLLPYELKQYYEASERGTIIYARPDALIGRELTLWHTRKPEGQPN